MIMPVFNAQEYLAQTLDSVLSQSLRPERIIIVDDNSTDATLEIIRSYDMSIEVHINTRQGMAAAINQGLQIADTEFVAFLDSDDLWLPMKAQAQIQYLLENPDMDVVCSSVLNFKKDHLLDSEYVASREFSPSRLFTASTFRRRTFEVYGGVDESVGHFGWLYEWWSRAGEAGVQCGMIEEVMLHRRIHDSNSWVRNRELGNKTLIELARRNIKRRSDD